MSAQPTAREIIIAQSEHLQPDELDALRMVTSYLYERRISADALRALCAAAEPGAKTTRSNCSWYEDDPNAATITRCIRRAVENGRCEEHQDEDADETKERP